MLWCDMSGAGNKEKKTRQRADSGREHQLEPHKMFTLCQRSSKNGIQTKRDEATRTRERAGKAATDPLWCGDHGYQSSPKCCESEPTFDGQDIALRQESRSDDSWEANCKTREMSSKFLTTG